jgi:hypothetical protein
MHIEELFVPVLDYPNYSVSNLGTVVNTRRDRDLVPWESSKKSGSKLIVKLYKDGVPANHFVHRLVAQAFFVDYDDEVDVYHLSDNKHDNCVTNLHLVKPFRRQDAYSKR